MILLNGSNVYNHDLSKSFTYRLIQKDLYYVSHGAIHWASCGASCGAKRQGGLTGADFLVGPKVFTALSVHKPIPMVTSTPWINQVN